MLREHDGADTLLPEITLAQALCDIAGIAHPETHNAQMVSHELTFRGQADRCSRAVCRHTADRVFLIIVRHMPVDDGAGQGNQRFFVALPLLPGFCVVIPA